MRACLIVAALGLLACAPGGSPRAAEPVAQAEAADPPYINARYVHPETDRPSQGQYHGGVTCEAGIPVIEFGGGVGLVRAENVRHEAMHFVQLAADDCEDTEARWEANPREWLEAEAEAFCTGVKVWPDTAQHRRIVEYRHVLATRHRGYGYGDVWSAIERWCHR